MKTKTIDRKHINIDVPVITRDFIEESFTRVSGATAVGGNDVQILVDATENYPEWIKAIESAEDYIFFESYIIHDDEQGNLFADLLIKKAKEGVDIKLIYDWMGGFGKTSRSYWKRLRKNGIEVRCFNPPKLLDPLGIFSRDHRKSIVVDGRVAFLSGLCVGQDWVGYPDRGVPPWRDTGVKILGPGVADVLAAFAEVWATMGPPLDSSRLKNRSEIEPAGNLEIRIVQTEPALSHIFRMDQLLSAVARETWWITDAYFVGTPSYLQSLKDASMDGVDVRILVPQSTDIAVIRDTTRSTYRPLLEAGVRVFEWNGPMVHAKTEVFDGRFSRIGSTNLNIASWFSNYELDVFIENDEFGQKVQEMFLNDLENSTEIILTSTNAKLKKPRRRPLNKRKGSGSVRKATAGALNAATSISSAMRSKTHLGPAESRLLFMVSFLLLGWAVLLILFPRGASTPLVVILLLLAIPTLIKAIQNYRNN